MKVGVDAEMVNKIYGEAPKQHSTAEEGGETDAK